MEAQRPKFAAMLNEIIRVLDDPQLLVLEVAASGRRHVGYGVQARDYDDVGAALVGAIGKTLGPLFTPEVQAAWREAYSLLAAVMRRAAATVPRDGTTGTAEGEVNGSGKEAGSRPGGRGGGGG
jgi:hemoglobin-like flavoprotein